MVIREAVEADLPAVVSLLEGLDLETPPTANETVWKTILAQPDRTVLIAEADGVVVGTLDLMMVANLTRGAKPFAIAENIAVAVDRRGSGFGRALLDEAVRRSQEFGCYKIQLMSNKRRTEAHAFYRSCGFEAQAEGFRRYF